VSARLPSAVLVSALVRRVNDAGGIGMVRAKGDDQAGGSLLIVQERGSDARCIERGLGPDGGVALISTGPTGDSNAHEIDDYWRRRRARDPDLWVVELDIAQAERFAAETILVD
jgi:hypothetical protein